MANAISHHISKTTPKKARVHPASVTMMVKLVPAGDGGCDGGKPLHRRTKLGRNTANTKARAMPPNSIHPEDGSTARLPRNFSACLKLQNVSGNSG